MGCSIRFLRSFLTAIFRRLRNHKLNAYLASYQSKFPDFSLIRAVVVDLPLLRVAVEGSDNPIIQGNPARCHFHLASRGTTFSGDIQRSSMLLEIYKCVQLNRCSVVCGCVLQKGQKREG